MDFSCGFTMPAAIYRYLNCIINSYPQKKSISIISVGTLQFDISFAFRIALGRQLGAFGGSRGFF
ncbi:MAG: hypothetical protein ACXVA9_11915, partial [Bdellovibrionales bacterium]